MNVSQIQFSQSLADIDLYQLQELFNLAAFWAKERSIKDWGTAIANSEPVVSIWDRELLIGFARATSDGIYRATIWDVAIHPDYQGKGLGSKLVETVLSHPRMQKVERVYLMTTHQQEFYEKIGFQVNNTTTMVLQNQSNFDALMSEEMCFQESL
ncbi:GNAT family N-acetyltransferase [Aphanizomenon flos-aquae NRERC-008]|jgi:ribosomal protein S18 acetylase RimI-like enzyme|uniref:Acetyltransferase n=2 Tax=Aphanizomenon flos-aquae TaxID=1176 RepID=A0A1B7X2Y6_APHFL|nr:MULTISPECIES: GNAT family N-acetyltransferase [Aphanizomenon]MBD1218956.1 GNAT family N-acetyltransferase [Aphanizomenon flos-aquae Clear-A1]MCE2903553.1 GNAT family N-acetyltransferase [Anabaena sp. CoA2_C59]MDJ0505217.1 GNAT family N-acetyltransferase [Nostocales cyanobacterium LE14-WE12]NTW18567.1 GNAT family N-acetyltransferase [Nostocales cyanobacterium W4_Combined_metabat2_030]OBQ19076.1 MAG: acetyltransferase [Anabaena sp. WA113]OBQ43736.1 MAG: acetyltransferase [Aphanizomenon flos-